MNTVYYRDNLKILREYINDESVTLFIWTHPLIAIANDNALFRWRSGSSSESQITAFEDTWRTENFADIIAL